VKKSDKKMTEDERREVLEAIARDQDAYPRDRIAAIKVLEEIAKREGPSELDRELDQLMRKK
jgi:hypothetical protein